MGTEVFTQSDDYRTRGLHDNKTEGWPVTHHSCDPVALGSSGLLPQEGTLAVASALIRGLVRMAGKAPSRVPSTEPAFGRKSLSRLSAMVVVYACGLHLFAWPSASTHVLGAQPEVRGNLACAVIHHKKRSSGTQVPAICL